MLQTVTDAARGGTKKQERHRSLSLCSPEDDDDDEDIHPSHQQRYDKKKRLDMYAMFFV